MRHLLIFVLLFSLALSLEAQENRFGLVAGANFSTFTDGIARGEFRPGFHAGITAERIFSDKWGFHAELIFSQQGMALRDGDAKLTVANDYAFIPLLFKWHPGEGSALLIGPAIGVLLRSRELKEYPGYDTRENTIKDFHIFDFGFQAGYEHSFNEHITLGIRYYNAVVFASRNSLERNMNSHFSIPLVYSF